ncbi:MAG TPA: hypothetical protein VJY86_02200 [Bacilli bacterium]|nr:hypothetical protein [Bacilli bacterium]
MKDKKNKLWSGEFKLKVVLDIIEMNSHTVKQRVNMICIYHQEV